MIAWVGILMNAADRKVTPSWVWLPLMALWANFMAASCWASR